MADRWDEGRRALDEVGPRTDLWQEAKVRAARAEGSRSAAPSGGPWLRRPWVLVAGAAALVAVVVVGLQVREADQERVETSAPTSTTTTPQTTVPVDHGQGTCGFGLRPAVVSGPVPPDEVLFPPQGQPAGQTTAYIEDDGIGVQIAVPGVLVIDLVGERVEEVQLDRGPAVLWLTEEFVQVRWSTGSQQPCDSFSVTAVGGSEAENRAMALHWAEQVLLPRDLAALDDSGDALARPWPGADQGSVGIWPETDEIQLSAEEPPWSASMGETAVVFAREVLGWDSAVAVGDATATEDGGRGGVWLIAAGVDDTRATRAVWVTVHPTVAGPRYRVTQVDPARPPSISGRIVVEGRRALVEHDALPQGVASVEVRWDHAGQVVEGDTDQLLPVVPGTPGSVVIRLLDADGATLSAVARTLPPGDGVIDLP